MIKVMIADDQELLRESLKILLSSQDDIEIAGLAADGEEVLNLIPSCRPDVILMDVRMPQMNGVQCTKEVKERYPDIQVIVLTTFDDDDYIYDALKYGASSYLLKGVSLDELHQAIVTVVSGGGVIQISPSRRCACFPTWRKTRWKVRPRPMSCSIFHARNGASSPR